MSVKVDAARAARAFVLIAAAAVAALAPSVAATQAPKAAQRPDLGWLDRYAVEAGEIAVRTSKDDGTITVDTAALIHASTEDIWNVLTACEIAPEYVSNVVSCESIEKLDGGRAELFVQTVKPIFFMPRFEHVFRLDYWPPDRIDVTGISGPIERMEGSWWFIPEPDGVLLVHTLEVDPGFPIPRFLLRATLRRELTTIMDAVRHVAEERAALEQPP